MKKLFASLMAATMVAGMSVSAFAYVDKDGNEKLDELDKDKAVEALGDADDDYAFGTPSKVDKASGGNSIYFPILVNAKEVEDDDDTAIAEGYFYATKRSEVEDLKATAKETEGKGTIKDVTIERVSADDHKAGVSKKIYCIKVKLNDYYKTEEGELEFDLTLKESGKEQLKVEDIYYTIGADDANSTLKGYAHFANVDTTAGKAPYYYDTTAKKNVELVKGAEDAWYLAADQDGSETIAKAYVSKDGKILVPTGASAAVKIVKVEEANEAGHGYEADFDDNVLELTVGENTEAVTLDEYGNGSDNEIEELYMETADGEMIVEGKMEEQDALFLGFELDPTDFQKEVMMENDKADVDTFNWVARPTFDFSMDVTMPVEDDRDNFLYEEIDGKLVEVEAKLNSDGDELKFETKTLGKYLLSDMELTAEKAEKEEAGEEATDAKEETEAKEDSKKANAETGASLVAVATAIALF